MADKLSINSKFDDLFYEPSDSEEEYTKKERELLKNVRSRTKKKDKEVEILKFSSSDDDDDDDGNDVEDDEEQDVLDNSDLEDDRRADDDIPDSKAWGNKRSLYYHTDFVDQDYSTYNEKDEDLALQEEQEAKAIQQRLAQQLDDIDFSLDVYADPEQDQLITENDVSAATAAKEEIDHEIKLKRDLENLSERQKLQLFKKDSPEFFGLMQDFEKYFQESQTILQPFLECIKKYDVQSPTIQFVETMNNLILTYCTNITFYLALKSKRLSIKNHPVIKRLVQTRQILQQLEQKYNNVVKNEILKVIEMIEGGCNIVFVPPSMENLKGEKKDRKTRVPKNKTAAATTLEDEDEFDDNDDMPDEDGEIVENSVDEDEEGEEGDERRGITYQMKKNKGLTPYRRKDLKNPRVKHRNKYRKALIRRKGAVRTVRKELKRYSGEISGIKATVKKSIKLKS